MNRVKIVEGPSAEKLEMNVNLWFVNNPGAQLKYVKYIHKGIDMADPFSAMIIYSVVG